jgi:CHRD domain
VTSDRGGRYWTAAALLAAVAWLGTGTRAEAHVELKASLDTAQEVPAPTVGASAPSGEAEMEVEAPEAGTMLSYKLTVEGLTGPPTAAHIHQAPAGTQGSVIFTLDHTTLMGEVGPLSQAQIDALFTGGLYVNVHTAANPNGEIRGQIAIRNTGDTCSCKTTPTPKFFKQCVKKKIKALEPDERKSDGVKALKKVFGKAACGKTKGPKKAIACCLPQTPIANIVLGRLCAALPDAKCTKLGGLSLGAGSSCFTDGKFENPCTPVASPSGAFVDAPGDGSL